MDHPNTPFVYRVDPGEFRLVSPLIGLLAFETSQAAKPPAREENEKAHHRTVFQGKRAARSAARAQRLYAHRHGTPLVKLLGAYPYLFLTDLTEHRQQPRGWCASINNCSGILIPQ
jgi:hypothetical protein